MPTINILVTAPGHPRDGALFPIDVSSDLSLADVKAYVSAETDLDTTKQALRLDGTPLTNDQATVQQAGIKDGDMVEVFVQPQNRRPPASVRPGASGQRGTDPAGGSEPLRQQLLQDSRALAAFRQRAPRLADAVNDPEHFRQVLEQIQGEERSIAEERDRQIAILNDDPFNVEAQTKIEEMIRQERVMENLEYATEHNPESFASVTMLYVNASVNGHKIKVMVDCGAQVTVMSPSCAEACNIMRLLDRRYASRVYGAGSAAMLGKVHSAPILIGTHYLPCSFSVVEGKTIDLLLGLDMLKRFQVNIDLKRNKLVFPHEEVDFLPESETPHLVWPELSDGEDAAASAVSGVAGDLVRPAGSAPHVPLSGGNFQGPGQTLGQPQASSSSESNTVSAPSGSSATAAPSAPSAQSSRHDEAKIGQLQALGFDRDQAVAALDASNGDVEMAVGLLFG